MVRPRPRAPVSRRSSGLELHVERSGKGPPVVLGHGLGGSARNFRPQAEALEPSYELVRFDARGHARSPAPAEARAYRPEAFVSDVAALVGSSAPAIVGGLSMGAGVALRCALERPEIVRALLLFAPPRGGEEQASWAREFARAIDEQGLEAAGAEFVWGARSRFDPKGARLIRQGFLEHEPHAIAHVLRELIAAQPSVSALEPRLKKLELPTLVVVGTRDTASLETAEQLSQAIPGARLERIAGAGHVVNLAAPDEFNRRLVAFLKSLA